jgi:hypothetical protein
MSAIDLGGPRQQLCSALRVRRLLAGELKGAEASLAEEHLASCERCRAVRAEVQAEQRALAQEVPFEAFAAGVAEKLAKAEERERSRVPLLARPTRRWVSALGMAAAAAAFFIVAVPRMQSSDPTQSEVPQHSTLERLRESRTKGGAAVTVFAVRGARTFALKAGEATEPGDKLLPSLAPNGHTQMLVALVEPGEVSVLFKGPARPGPLPEAFEWTGAAPEAKVAALYSDGPIDEQAAVAALQQGTVAGLSGVEVVFHPLRRAPAK